MERKLFIMVMLLIAVGLIAFNLGMRGGSSQETREISGSEYTNLHTVASLNMDVAERLGENFNQERLTRAEYNRIMQKFDRIRTLKEQQSPTHKSRYLRAGQQALTHQHKEML